jgi:hypothetical protein
MATNRVKVAPDTSLMAHEAMAMGRRRIPHSGNNYRA